MTTVNLDDLGLRKLAHLDQLPNLCWFSVAFNSLTSLDGIIQCSNLEELTLDGNLVHSIEGIGNLHSLKWLSLSSNQLSMLPDDLRGLSKLRYFNISHNAISTLNHLKVL